jgi:hypothetical protein
MYDGRRRVVDGDVTSDCVADSVVVVVTTVFVDEAGVVMTVSLSSVSATA